MKRDYEIKYHDYEIDHWWFRGRRDVITRILNDTSRDLHVFEIGCSGGVLLYDLGFYGFKHLEGIDISENAIKTCHARGITNVHVASGEQTGAESNSKDIVIASDVLEHIENDTQAIKEWQRILKPGGSLIIFVPAFMSLWSEHDEANEHKKRYTKKEMQTLLLQNGFTIKRISYWNFLLFLPTLIMRQLLRWKKRSIEPQSQLFLPHSLLNSLLFSLLRIENYLLIRGVSYPIGVSLFAIAQKN